MNVYIKEIKYDRETRDFAMYLNNELVGYAASYLEADNRLNDMIHASLTHGAA